MFVITTRESAASQLTMTQENRSPSLFYNGNISLRLFPQQNSACYASLFFKEFLTIDENMLFIRPQTEASASDASYTIKF